MAQGTPTSPIWFLLSSLFPPCFIWSVLSYPVLLQSLPSRPVLFPLLLFCSALFWSRAGLLARVTPSRLIDPSGCRVDGKHMGSLHLKLKNNCLNTVSHWKTSTDHHAETWQDKSRSISAEQALRCAEDWVCTGGLVCLWNIQYVLILCPALCERVGEWIWKYTDPQRVRFT